MSEDKDQIHAIRRNKAETCLNQFPAAPFALGLGNNCKRGEDRCRYG